MSWEAFWSPLPPVWKSEERAWNRELWVPVPFVGLLPSDAWEVRERSVCEAGEATSARPACVLVDGIVWLLWWLSTGVAGK